MAKVKVAVYGSPLKTVYIDTSVGSRVDALQAQLNALSAAGSATRHSSLQGLQIGDDHPQYTMWAANETVKATWNFDVIPLIHEDSGFWWAMASMGLTAIALALLFWRKRYLERSGR